MINLQINQNQINTAMSTSDQLKLQAKAVHESVHGDPKDAKIKELEQKVSRLTGHINDIENAIEYCNKYDIQFDCILSLMVEYENRHENDEYVTDQEEDKADFDNQLEKEDW